MVPCGPFVINHHQCLGYHDTYRPRVLLTLLSNPTTSRLRDHRSISKSRLALDVMERVAFGMAMIQVGVLGGGGGGGGSRAKTYIALR